MCLSDPSIPAQQAPPRMVQAADPAVQAALDADRKRRQTSGPSSLSTGAGILAPPSTSMKTLLGA